MVVVVDSGVVEYFRVFFLYFFFIADCFFNTILMC